MFKYAIKVFSFLFLINLISFSNGLSKQVISNDSPPDARVLGNCIREPYPRVFQGEGIKAVFVGGQPLNNQGKFKDSTLFTIEKKLENGLWELVKTDTDTDVISRWQRPFLLGTVNNFEVRWNTTENTPFGIYKIRHFGRYQPADSTFIKNYFGTTKEFNVSPLGFEESF